MSSNEAPSLSLKEVSSLKEMIRSVEMERLKKFVELFADTFHLHEPYGEWITVDIGCTWFDNMLLFAHKNGLLELEFVDDICLRYRPSEWIIKYLEEKDK